MSVLVLIASSAPRSARAAVFGEFGGRDLDDAFLDPIRQSARRGVSDTNPAWTAPGAAASQTAVLLGLPWATDQGLRGPDFGAWQGRMLDDVGVSEPEAMAAWARDVTAAPHGGESLAKLVTRLRDDVLLRAATSTAAARTVAIAPSLVVRALIVGALELPESAVLRLDVEPWSVTTLTHHGGRWNLRLTA